MKAAEIDSVKAYCNSLGLNNSNEHFAIVHINDWPDRKYFSLNWNIYAVFLKETKGCSMTYGLTKYDYDAHTVVSVAPGQTTSIEKHEGQYPNCTALVFDKDYIANTSVGNKIRKYEFFSYASNEALHASDDEWRILTMLGKNRSRARKKGR